MRLIQTLDKGSLRNNNQSKFHNNHYSPLTAVPTMTKSYKTSLLIDAVEDKGTAVNKLPYQLLKHRAAYDLYDLEKTSSFSTVPTKVNALNRAR